MAIKPAMNPSSKKTQFSPTAVAIAGSFVLSIILATIVTGNPFSALRRAYATLDGQAERPVPTVSGTDPGPSNPSGGRGNSGDKTTDPSAAATDAGAGGQDTTAVPGAAPSAKPQ